MNTKRTFSPRRAVALCAAVILVLGMATVAYASDFGGIRRTIQLWIHGDQTTVEWDVQNGQYQGTDKDTLGLTHNIGGGGVTLDEDGNERPMTEEELLEHLNRPEVEYKEDGTVWVYYHDQSIEITDRFDEDGVCFFLLKDGSKTLYMTVKYNHGYALSQTAYVQPWEFNTGD